MLQASKIAVFDQHEEVFLSRYRQLRAWAMQLTENDPEQAEDLVHDTYIQFTLARPDLDSVENLNGYIYAMMRNLNVSRLRRSQCQQNRTLSIVDYDSAELGLRTSDPREQIRLQDELRQICQYACMRKQTSKAGSVLILRFLHGYYPREIARITQSTREAVEERLRIARSEVRQYLSDPKSLRFMSAQPIEAMQVPRMGYAQLTDQLLSDLRKTIFDSCQDECISHKRIRETYEDQNSVIDSHLLAHIVSCPTCLDQANETLGLPLLSERFATDTLKTDSNFKDGDGGGGGVTPGSASETQRRECRRRARQVAEHRPLELSISVNGYLMAAQKIGSDLNEQTLNINVSEKIEFVEVFSEQGVRLLFLAIDDPTKQTPDKRTANVKLSDDRSLEANLSFGDDWSTVQVIYSDPSLRAESAQENATKETNGPAGGWIFSQVWKRFLNRLTSSAFWLRPGTVTAAVALILIAALLVSRFQVTTVSAAELLQRSTAAYDAAAADPKVVLHRTLRFEERRANGEVTSKRIEIWQSNSHQIKLRRVYDEQNNLVAGEWTRPDGTSTVYQRGAAPQARTSPEISAKAILQTGELWRLDLLAKEFKQVVGGPEALTVEEGANTFALSYGAASADKSNELHGATLVLSKNDLQAIEQSFTLTRNGEAYVYKFTEAGSERNPVKSLAPTVLQPEPELLGPLTKDAEKSRVVTDASQTAVANARPNEAFASSELEIEVTYLLNQIKANLGEQVTLTRTPSGSLRLEALVETDSRKGQILTALAPVRNNPAIKVEVITVAEAAKRQEKGSKATEVREVEVVNNRMPADAQLRSYFSTRLAGSDAIDEEIKRFSNRAMSHSRNALMQAAALKRLVTRFSIEEIRELAPDARSKWLSMIDQHAQAYRREVQTLRNELKPIFQGSSSSTQRQFDSGPAQLGDRLVQLSYANDESVRSAFTVSEQENAMVLNSAKFWRSLAEAEELAEAIQSAYRK